MVVVTLMKWKVSFLAPVSLLLGPPKAVYSNSATSSPNYTVIYAAGGPSAGYRPYLPWAINIADLFEQVLSLHTPRVVPSDSQKQRKMLSLDV